MKPLTILNPVFLMAVSILLLFSAPTNFQRSSPVAVGEMAPDFALVDQDGNTVKLSDARTKSPVVLVFYRGYW